MDAERTAFLITGVVVLLAAGQLLARGESVVRAGVRRSPDLGAGLFYLFGLVFVVLLTLPNTTSGAIEAFLLRLGLFLVVLAIVYGGAVNLRERGPRRRPSHAGQRVVN